MSKPITVSVTLNLIVYWKVELKFEKYTRNMYIYEGHFKT